MIHKIRIWISWLLPSGSLDKWYAEIDDDESCIRCNMVQSLQWLRRHEIMNNQYQFYAMALTTDEWDKVKEFIRQLRCHEPAAANVKPACPLTEHQRRMIILCDEGWKPEDIAKELEIKVGKVNQQFKRWRTKYNERKSHMVARKLRTLFGF